MMSNVITRRSGRAHLQISSAIALFAFSAVWVLLAVSQLYELANAGAVVEHNPALFDDARRHAILDTFVVAVAAFAAVGAVVLASRRSARYGSAALKLLAAVGFVLLAISVEASVNESNQYCPVATRVTLAGGGEGGGSALGGWSWTEWGTVVYATNATTGDTKRVICR